MDNNQLINEGFNNVFSDGEQNVKSAKLLDLQEMSNESGTVDYTVTVDFQFKKEITSASGEQPRFIILHKESDQSGWRIHSEGTGP